MLLSEQGTGVQRMSLIYIIQKLIEKGIIDFTNNEYVIDEYSNLYSKDTGIVYDVNQKIIDSDLENGSRLILI